MAYHMLEHLVRQGHEVRVLTARRCDDWLDEMGGMSIIYQPDDKPCAEHVQWADVVVTHLDRSRGASRLARLHRKPIVHLVHYADTLRQWRIQLSDVDLVVFNALHVADSARWRGPQIVVRPPVPPEYYEVPRGEHVSLLNLNANKGGNLFWELARRMPDVTFVGVKGAYAQQVVPALVPRNVLLLDTEPDVRHIYRLTRILLMPSEKETWGRTALEAACSGIPTICSPTDGLKECMGDAATYVERTDIEGWERAIRSLLTDAELYRRRSIEAHQHALAMAPYKDLDAWEQALQTLVKRDTLKVDVVASRSHYLDHMEPVWKALPPHRRGPVYVTQSLTRYALQRRLTVVPEVSGQTISQRLRMDGRGPALVASIDDLRTADGGARRSVLMEHGVGQTYGRVHASYAGGPGRKNVVAFLVPGPLCAEVNRAAYPEAKVVEIGSPRLDRWVNLERAAFRERPVVAISFHWQCDVVPETKSAWPHYRNALQELTQRYHVLGHGHPRIIGELTPQYRAMGIEVVESFDEVLRRADLLAVDNSSVLYEFAATGKPVVVLNAPWYRRNVHHGLRFWDLAAVGVNCNEPQHLVESIRYALSDPPEQQQMRRFCVEAIYGENLGTSARRAAAALEDLLADWPVQAPVSKSNREVTRVTQRELQNPTRCRALRSFMGRSGEGINGGADVPRGHEFTTSADIAQQLAKKGLVEILGSDEPKPAVSVSLQGQVTVGMGPAETKVLAPAETKPAPKHDPNAPLPEDYQGVSVKCADCGKPFGSLRALHAHSLSHKRGA